MFGEGRPCTSTLQSGTAAMAQSSQRRRFDGDQRFLRTIGARHTLATAAHQGHVHDAIGSSRDIASQRGPGQAQQHHQTNEVLVAVLT
jgi:hypothetical protein